MNTVTVFCNQQNCTGRGDWHSMVAFAEDGECLAGHVCSNHGWAYHDMGINENGWKRDLYAKKYPDGFTVRFLENNDEIQAFVKALPPEKTEAQ